MGNFHDDAEDVRQDFADNGGDRTRSSGARNVPHDGYDQKEGEKLRDRRQDDADDRRRPHDGSGDKGGGEKLSLGDAKGSDRTSKRRESKWDIAADIPTDAAHVEKREDQSLGEPQKRGRWESEGTFDVDMNVEPDQPAESPALGAAIDHAQRHPAVPLPNISGSAATLSPSPVSQHHSSPHKPSPWPQAPPSLPPQPRPPYPGFTPPPPSNNAAAYDPLRDFMDEGHRHSQLSQAPPLGPSMVARGPPPRMMPPPPTWHMGPNPYDVAQGLRPHPMAHGLPRGPGGFPQPPFPFPPRLPGGLPPPPPSHLPGQLPGQHAFPGFAPPHGGPHGMPGQGFLSHAAGPPAPPVNPFAPHGMQLVAEGMPGEGGPPAMAMGLPQPTQAAAPAVAAPPLPPLGPSTAAAAGAVQVHQAPPSVALHAEQPPLPPGGASAAMPSGPSTSSTAVNQAVMPPLPGAGGAVPLPAYSSASHTNPTHVLVSAPPTQAVPPPPPAFLAASSALPEQGGAAAPPPPVEPPLPDPEPPPPEDSRAEAGADGKESDEMPHDLGLGVYEEDAEEDENKGQWEEKTAEVTGAHDKKGQDRDKKARKEEGKVGRARDAQGGKQLLQVAVAEVVKEALRPSWKERELSKEAFKKIAKRAVAKIVGAVEDRHMPRSAKQVTRFLSDGRKEKIVKLVLAYVDKYKAIKD